MAIQPDTELRLIKCPLTMDNKNQFTFATKQAQETYFKSLPYLEIEESYYQRKDNVIMFPAHIDEIIEYNYCMYKNNNYSNKWFYAFIINMEYKNDGTTMITIGTDVWQTWQFDITFNASFVEREHVAVIDDTYNKNLEPENLEMGEPIIREINNLSWFEPAYIIAYSRNPYEDGISDTNILNNYEYNGIPSGIYYYACGINNFPLKLKQINDLGLGQNIITCFSVPIVAINDFTGYTHWSGNNNEKAKWDYSVLHAGNFGDWLSDYTAPYKTLGFSNPTYETTSDYNYGFEGYIPKNKKLYHYPFCYLGINPPNGAQKIIKYEDLVLNTQNNSELRFMCEINPNPTALIVPYKYKGSKDVLGNSINAPSEAVAITGYPSISYITDYYNSWLAQNSGIINVQMRQEQYNYENNVAIDQARSGIGAIGKLASSISNQDVGGAMTGGSDYAINQKMIEMQHQNHGEYVNMMLAQQEKQAMLPNSANLGSSNATMLGYDQFTIATYVEYRIKKEFAEKIDKYFSVYGYATKTLKVPNLNNRSNWNYVKTVGANILGNIPSLDLQRIKDMFDSGVTLWHTTSHYLDYTQTNS